MLIRRYSNVGQITCLVSLLLLPISAHAYPPDNAAVLYYRAFSLMEHQEGGLSSALREYAKGKAPLNSQVRQYLDNHQRVIDMIFDATQIEHCDWGVDYSKGLETLWPELSKCRQSTFLVAAHAMRLSQGGEHMAALKQCLGIHHMARHVDRDALVSRLVSIAMNAIANQAIGDIVSQASLDEQALIWLKSEITRICATRGRFSAALQRDAQHCVPSISAEGRESILKCLEDSVPSENLKVVSTKIQQADQAFFKANLSYYLNHVAMVQDVLDLSFAEAYQRLEQLGKRPTQDAKTNDEALIAAILIPNYERCYCLDIRAATHFNAIKTAVELFLVKARTGHLPETLADTSSQDLFSGQDFIYQKSQEGFTLRCRTKDPSSSKSETYDFAFKSKE
jgi:hypothetical protein